MSLQAKSKSLFTDRVSDVGGQASESPLQKQAAELLSSRDGNAAFAPRISATEASADIAKGSEIVASTELAHAAEGGAKDLNLSAELTVKLLDMHPSDELYANLVDNHQQDAVDLAVHDQRFERMAMSSDNHAVRDEVSMRRYGQPAVA